MSVSTPSIPILLLVVVCGAAIAAALYFAIQATRKRAHPARAHPARGPVALDLAGRLPAKRRRPCGRHGAAAGNCDDCEHKHDHDHNDPRNHHNDPHDHHNHHDSNHCARGD